MIWIALAVLGFTAILWTLAGDVDHPGWPQPPEVWQPPAAPDQHDVEVRIGRIRLASRYGDARRGLADVQRRTRNIELRHRAQAAFVSRAWEEVETRRSRHDVYRTIEVLDEIVRLGGPEDARRAAAQADQLRGTVWEP